MYLSEYSIVDLSLFLVSAAYYEVNWDLYFVTYILHLQEYVSNTGQMIPPQYYLEK